MPQKQHLKSQEEEEEEEEKEEEEEQEQDAAIIPNSRRSRKRVRSKATRAPSVSSSLRGGYSSSIANRPLQSSSGLGLKRAFLVGRRGGPSTPVPSWKVFDDPFSDAMAAVVAAEHQQHQGHQGRRLAVSARRLAATLWELQEVPFSRGGANRIRGIQQQQHQHQQQEQQRSSGLSKRTIQHGQFLSPASSHVSQRSLRRSSIQYKFGEGARKQPHSSGHVAGAHSQVLRLLERHTGPRTAQITDASNAEIEADGRAITPTISVLDMKAIPRDPGYGPTTSSELLKVLNRIWSLEEQHTSSMTLVATLRAELDHARAQVQELMLNQKSHRKEVENLTKTLAEEKAIWRDQEQETIREAVQSIKEELEDERKSKRRLEILHRKVARDLHDVKGTLGKTLQDLERERKARELMEDVCDELAREIGEDKARVEELKRESVKVREEVEEERKMLQMAEVWREERVQMKLMEAKLELEEKNTALDKLRSELEAFLKAKRAGESKDEGNRPTADAKRDMRRHSVDAVIGRNLADSFHSNEGRVPGRNSVDSIRGNEARPAVRNVQDADDDGSGDDDDLHSIELNNEPFVGNVGGSQWGYHSLPPQEVESKGRRSTDRRVSNMDRGKQRQGGKSQGLERTRSSQFEAGVKVAERREKDFQWDYSQESQWIERSIERGEMREWGREKRIPVEAEKEVNSPWQSDPEESQDHITFSPRGMGRNMQGHTDSLARIGGAQFESTNPQYEADAKLELFGSHAGWRHRAVGNTRDLHSNSVFSPVQQPSHVTASPTRQWSHYWSSPDPGSPHHGRSSKGSTDMSRISRDNSLKAKLLEAKLEGQQARLRSGKGL